MLGPNLWNVMYNSLLIIDLPPEVKIIVFVDDVAVVSIEQAPIHLEKKLVEALGDVEGWTTIDSTWLGAGSGKVRGYCLDKKKQEEKYHNRILHPRN